jgi:amino acid adenylation domain-containing protein
MPETAQLSDAKRKLLTQYLRGKIDVRPANPLISRRAADAPVPLTYAQEQVWLHAQMAPEVPLYNEPVTIHYTGPLDVAALERSFNEILRRHEAWRSCFVTVDGRPMQQVEPSLTVSLPVIDLRHLAEDQREAEALRIATHDAAQPLDLACAPLFRARLIRLKDEEHRLYLTLSHIIFDGVAIYRVFLPELSTLYAAFSAGQPSPRPELPIQQGDFAIWQRQSVTAENTSEHLAYWRKQLGAGLPVLELPCDRSRPAVQTFRGSMYPFTLGPALTAALRKMCHEEGVTPFQLLLAGFAGLLHRYTGEEYIPIGSVTAGRDFPETQRLLGYFLNTVVLCADAGGNPTFRELARRMRTLTLETLQHDSVPFGQLIQEFSPARDLSRNPLFQVMFSLEPPMPEVDSAWRLTQMDVDTGASKYDLYLELDERREEVLARFHYSTDLFDLATMERMARHWITLLEAAVADPGRRISDLPILTESERHQLLAWNDTDCEYPHEQSIHDLFDAQSRRTPDATAIQFEDQKVTYRQLRERSNQLAHYLKKLGVGPGFRVGLCLERSPEMVVALLAILKAGAAYVPLDPNYPSSRLAFMIEDSQAAFVLTDSKLIDRLQGTQARQICLDTDREKIGGEDSSQPEVRLLPDHSAYVMYTSGSTGKPKGVIGTHRATINRLCWMWREYPFQPGEVCCQKTTLSFVDSVWEIFGPLLAGVPSIILPNETVTQVDRLIDALASHHVTRIVLVPSLLRAILSCPDLPEKLRALKIWISSGEALTKDLAQSFSERLPGHTLLNLYGSTEVAADATYYEVRHPEKLSSIPIGRPIANTRAYILDAYRQPVPINVPGEICIGGDAVSLGYLQRPELTAERFIPDPFSKTQDARLYKTGDLGCYRVDGNIEYLGRRDHQVKIRGFRIELGEIESVLRDHPGVRQCVLIAREDESGERRLVAYFEPPSQQSLDVNDIRTYLKARLPEHMVPSVLVPMPKLPLNANGKIDRHTLPDAPHIRSESHTALVAPRDEFEQILARLWSKVLRVPDLSVHDNFFELGGHSLLAVRIMVEIEKVFQRRLPLATLVQAPTIAELAAILRKQNWSPTWASLVPIRPGGSRPPLFLMHAHGGNVLEYHSLVNHLEPDQPVYALQARGLDGNLGEGRTIEVMAADYIEEIRSLQPEGPYFLGGFCFGGLLAWEAAQQLTAAGQQVALLVLIQSMNPAFARFRPEVGLFRQWWYRSVKRLDLERDNLASRGMAYFGERCREFGQVMRAKTAIAFDNAFGRKRRAKTELSMGYVLESLRLEHARAYARYALRPYGGDVLLLRAEKQLPGLMIDEASGWNQAVGGQLEVCHVPGHQQTILGEPNVSILAKSLSEYLRAAQRGQSSTVKEQSLTLTHEENRCAVSAG